MWTFKNILQWRTVWIRSIIASMYNFQQSWCYQMRSLWINIQCNNIITIVLCDLAVRSYSQDQTSTSINVVQGDDKRKVKLKFSYHGVASFDSDLLISSNDLHKTAYGILPSIKQTTLASFFFHFLESCQVLD